MKIRPKQHSETEFNSEDSYEFFRFRIHMYTAWLILNHIQCIWLGWLQLSWWLHIWMSNQDKLKHNMHSFSCYTNHKDYRVEEKISFKGWEGAWEGSKYSIPTEIAQYYKKKIFDTEHIFSEIEHLFLKVI